MSILAYALSGYIQSHFEVPARYEVQITPLDSSVMISAQNKNPKRAEKDRFQQEIPYPIWLASFFEDDEMFAYLTPVDDTPLEEVIADLQAHVDSDADDLYDDDETDDEDDDTDDDEDEEDDDSEETEDTVVTPSAHSEGDPESVDGLDSEDAIDDDEDDDELDDEDDVDEVEEPDEPDLTKL